MSKAVGCLAYSPITEYLPLLGSYTIASNEFALPLSGFVLYNITDAIVANSFAGWFSRWLLAQDSSQNTSLYFWSVRALDRHNSIDGWSLIPIAVGIVLNLAMTMVPFMLGDWYGLVSAISMDVSIFVRMYLISQNRNALDRAAITKGKEPEELVKTMCILSDNKAVTVIAPRHVVIGCFLTTPKPSKPHLYKMIRALGWLNFSVFVITIDLSTLAVQLAAVSLTLGATILTALGWMTDEVNIGTRLQVCRREHTNFNGRRMEAYAQLDFTQQEEETMIQWSLFPARRNCKWWARYYNHKKRGSQEDA